MAVPTMEELEALLDRLKSEKVEPTVPAGCFTTAQLGRAAGSTAKAARFIVHDAVTSGRAEFAGMFPVRNICGTLQRTPHYRLVKQKGDRRG